MSSHSKSRLALVRGRTFTQLDNMSYSSQGTGVNVMTNEKQALSATEAQRLFLRYWSQGSVITSRHFEERASERDVDSNDIQFLLENGEIRKTPSFNEKYGDWNYVIEGKDLGGIDLAVVFALDENTAELILITVRDI